jgi:hypothetical protein
MPYKLDGNNIMHQVNGKWKVKQKCASHESAVSAMRLLQGIEHGWKLTKKG